MFVIDNPLDPNSTVLNLNNETDMTPDQTIPPPPTPPPAPINTPTPYPTTQPTPTPTTTPMPTSIVVSILSPSNNSIFGSLLVNDTFPDVTFHLIYKTNEAPSWVGYNIDGGSNATVTHNDTVVDMAPQIYSHTLTLFANDTQGNWATPQTVNFYIAINPGPAPTPTQSTSRFRFASVPEFPTWTALPGILVASIVVAVAVKRKTKMKN